MKNSALFSEIDKTLPQAASTTMPSTALEQMIADLMAAINSIGNEIKVDIVATSPWSQLPDEDQNRGSVSIEDGFGFQATLTGSPIRELELEDLQQGRINVRNDVQSVEAENWFGIQAIFNGNVGDAEFEDVNWSNILFDEVGDVYIDGFNTTITIEDVEPDSDIDLEGDNLILDASEANDDMNVFANGGNMNIATGSGGNRVYTNEGNDVINTGDGNDYVRADEGNDTLYGGAGRDDLFGEEGDDVIFGDAGNDYLSGGDGNDLISGGTGNDVIVGGDGGDLINGNDGDDFINAGNGADRIIDGAGNDIMYLGRNDGDPDTIIFNQSDEAQTNTVHDFEIGIDQATWYDHLGNAADAAQDALVSGGTAVYGNQSIEFIDLLPLPVQEIDDWYGVKG